ncbi:Mrs2p (nucleomorph) [Guillardia theta]|uniref:Magnesium transporter n=1 Tax=Guillardia theta TaxID=55529 RepID=Q98S66_GUITH|nr:Mrs2p [Guillardia theta]AAK39715.1 Mrs2p [Guillardia theta]|mmetsp:Transcript_2602/g.8690  ORF Transcript_2602/g.8690 Transcript_2602/m.8690 type:complete len:383 (+) Transcript_2602:871-2019(+)
MSKNDFQITRMNDLVCIEFNSNGISRLRKISRKKIITESRTFPKNYFQKLFDLYFEYSYAKEFKKFPINLINEKDKRQIKKFLDDSIQLRDIRQVDPYFESKPTFWIRNNAILLSLEQIRAIVLFNKLFLFDPDNPKVQRAGKIISEKLEKFQEDSVEDRKTPFEFKALEGIFVNICMNLEKDFSYLEPTILENLDDLPTKLTSRMLEELRSFKQRLSQFSIRSQEVQRILQETLENENNLPNHYLSINNNNKKIKLKTTSDYYAIEIISEGFLQVVEHLTHRAELLDNAIDDTEDLVNIRLDTIRNKILFVELSLNIVSLTLSAGGLVAGLMGMNLGIPIFKEENSSTTFFILVSFLIIFSSLTLYLWLLNWCRIKGLYSI